MVLRCEQGTAMDDTLTIDGALLTEAQETLGREVVRATVEAALRDAVRRQKQEAGRFPAPSPAALAEIARVLRDARRPPTEVELAQRRAVAERMDQVRVKVGPEFNVVRELRAIRERAERGLSDQEYDD
ncbi:MAG: hypothetical protein ACRDI2_03790 [Chloroflexota bacterium]